MKTGNIWVDGLEVNGKKLSVEDLRLVMKAVRIQQGRDLCESYNGDARTDTLTDEQYERIATALEERLYEDAGNEEAIVIENVVSENVKNSTISVSSEDIAAIGNYLNGEEELDEDETLIYTATFDDGNQMDVKVCGGDMPWTEAALFDKRGYQLAYTEPCVKFTGDWELEFGNKVYVATVKEVA